MKKSMSSTTTKGGQGSWQEAAALRLKKKELSTQTQLSQLSLNPKDEQDETESDPTKPNGPIITDLEADIDLLMKKLETENASILEAKSIRSKSRDYREVLKQAKHGAQQQKETDPTFFITSVDGLGEKEADTEHSKSSSSVKYPNFEKEVRLAREANMNRIDKKMAKLQSQANDLQNESSFLKNIPKGNQIEQPSRKQKRSSKKESGLPSLAN
jgi:hypothetical protein